MVRRAAKVDANQGAIIDALRSVPGVTVFSLAGVGRGCPDLLVGIKGATFLVEVKDGSKVPSAQRLTRDQRHFTTHWTGAPVVVLRNVEMATAWAEILASGAISISKG